MGEHSRVTDNQCLSVLSVVKESHRLRFLSRSTLNPDEPDLSLRSRGQSGGARYPSTSLRGGESRRGNLKDSESAMSNQGCVIMAKARHAALCTRATSILMRCVKTRRDRRIGGREGLVHRLPRHSLRSFLAKTRGKMPAVQPRWGFCSVCLTRGSAYRRNPGLLNGTPWAYGSPPCRSWRGRVIQEVGYVTTHRV